MFLMKKIAWKRLIIVIIISGIISNIGSSLHNFEEPHQNYPLGLSNSDSWSKILKEGGVLYYPRCELVNESLYIIGRMELEDKPKRYLYVSKFNTSGIMEWEVFYHDYDYISYIFDNDNNLVILSYNYTTHNIILIKLNSSGALLFSKELSLGVSYDLLLVLGGNNSLLLVYHSDYHKLTITKFNDGGQFLWSKSFNIDFFEVPPYVVAPYIITDSGNNMYIYFENNSRYNIAKINGSGVIMWQMGVDRIRNLMIDSNDNLFILGGISTYEGYILKLNSTGDLIKEIPIEGEYRTYDLWYLNDLLLYSEYYKLILCYDLNLDLKWNFSWSDYMVPHSNLQTFLAKDSHDNVYVIQNNRLGNIDLVKISSTGEFLSRIIWGSIFDEKPESLVIDLDNNIYFICYCEYYNNWRDRFRYTIFVKNPVNGGTPPEPGSDLDIRDYFLFSVAGIACIISPIALLSILRRNKKRI